MQTYLVGGAVRDELLGLPVQDRDWVVVGASAADLLDAGYTPVGKDFPVFLHPTSKEEYALARVERKTARGYRGFELDASPSVTLEQDLERRDLTINAMARDEQDQLIDPFGGADDLRNGLLRHVSDAFAEDPVRVLRVARFAARYATRGFRVAEPTLALMREMVASGEVDALVPERVWHELRRALGEPTPSAFIRTLRDCDALARILPEVDALFGVPQPPQHHPEIDTGEHILLVLDQAAKSGASTRVGFACLLHDLGKALTPAAELPRHRGHEQAGLDPVKAVCRRLRVPRAYQVLAERVCLHHLKVHTALELKPATIVKLIDAIDGWRQPQRFAEFLQACEADARGRAGGMAERDYPQIDFLRRCREVAAAVDVDGLLEQGLRDEKLGQAIRRERVRAVAALAR